MKVSSLVGLVLLGLPLFISLETSSIWDSSEAYYVQTPREMLEHGDWVSPRFNGQLRLNKPPLSYWLVALFYDRLGVSLFWERFVIALLAYGCLWTVFLLGKLLVSERVGLLATVIFATTFRFQILAHRLLIDILLLFCILVALTAFLYWWKQDKKIGLVVASLFLALGFLAKGPIILLPLAILAVFTVFSGSAERLGRAPLFWSLSIFILVSSSWYLVLGFTLGWDHVSNFFWKENFGRFTTVDFGPSRGFLYYLPVFLADYFPWSIIFLGCLACKSKKVVSAGQYLPLLLTLWLAAFICFFSLSHNKQEYYILPVYPVVSVWVAIYLDKWIPPRWMTVLLIGLLVLLTGILGLATASLFGNFALWWLPLVPLLGVCWTLARSRFHMTAWVLSAFYASAFAVYMEPMEEYRPVHHLAKFILSRHQIGDEFAAGYYRLSTPSLAFYLNQPILELNESEQAVEVFRKSFPVYLIMSPEDYIPLKRELGKMLQIEEARPKLYTSFSALTKGWKRGRFDLRSDAWTRPVYLVSNQGG